VCHGIVLMGDKMGTVLFGDEMEEVKALSCAALQQHGYTVMAARDGCEALSVAREHRDPIDLLITDVMMPRLGGPDLCRALKDCHPEARVLFMYPADELGEAASFLQKPFTPGVLLRRVSGLLSERSGALDFRSNGLHI
jgi:two-component system, cell cycle sensor histidine kinase and response regulator CckA